jgi:MYXO-CTERM domain-containing protein
MRSWTANASYSGNSDVVPAPGAIALAGLGGLLIARRKRA